MSDESGDLYGKIDALLGKRAGFAGSAFRPVEADDFPLLTEVIEPAHADAESVAGDDRYAVPPATALHETGSNWQEPPSQIPVLEDWEAVLPSGTGVEPALQPEASIPGEHGQAEPPEIAACAAEPIATEARVNPDIPLQPVDDARMEAMLRRVVREELERLLGRG